MATNKSGSVYYEGYIFEWTATINGNMVQITDCDAEDSDDEELMELLEEGEIQTDDVARFVLSDVFGIDTYDDPMDKYEIVA